MRPRFAPVLVALTLVACSDGGPQAGPGTLTATVISPNGVEGAAVVTFFGPGIGDLTSQSGALYWDRVADTIRAVLIDPDGGGLAFTVAVDDTTRKPEGLVVEVAGPDDQLRSGVSAYTLEFRR